MEYPAAIALEIVEPRHLNSPRKVTADEHRGEGADYRTKAIDPPSLLFPGHERRAEGAGRIHAVARYRSLKRPHQRTKGRDHRRCETVKVSKSEENARAPDQKKRRGGLAQQDDPG